MTEAFNQALKQAADDIITLSAALDQKMEKWSDMLARRGKSGQAHATGFINKITAKKGVNMIVDIHTPAGKKEAVLRTYCINSKLGDDQAELFDDVALDFTPPYELAQQLA